MTQLKVKRLRPTAKLPYRATEHATGFDLYACLDAAVELGPDVTLVPTGVAIEIPPGYDVQVRPRSGLGRQGVDIIFGTIDPDYRGEILVSMRTFGSRGSYVVQDGDRIAQLVVGKIADVEVVEADELAASQRGDGGHGSTGR